jgi:alpha-D-xyloside xylohydrolase
MLGGDLLVAPVFSASGEVSYYVPAGRWRDLLRGTVIEGPCWVAEQHGFDTAPVLVRPGAVIAMGARDDRPDYDYLDGVTLRVDELCEGAQVTVSIPTMTGGVGARFAIARTGRELRVERSGAPANWRILLVGRNATPGSGEVVTSTPDGAVVDVAAGTAVAVVVLDASHR